MVEDSCCSPAACFCPAARGTLKEKLPGRSAPLPFTITAHSLAKCYKPLCIAQAQNWTSWNAGGCAIRHISLWTVVEQRFHLKKGGVLKYIWKYNLFSAMLYMRSTCNVLLWVFLGVWWWHRKTGVMKIFLLVLQCEIWIWRLIHTPDKWRRVMKLLMKTCTAHLNVTYALWKENVPFKKNAKSKGFN